MTALLRFLKQSQHAALVEEYIALENAEDKLTWLMERTPLQLGVPAAECTPERRVPGCLSGLWLGAGIHNGICVFNCTSESDVVQGIGSFLCDLYSDRPSSEVVQIGALFASELKLDGLLTLTRRRAVSSIVSFIVARAKAASEERVVIITPDRAA